jgi:hypothetical protein
MKIMVECTAVHKTVTSRSTIWEVTWDVTSTRREGCKDYIHSNGIMTRHHEEPDFIPGKIYQIEFNPT